MTITINGTTGITNDGGYTGDGVVFADTTPANTLVTDTSGNVGIGTGFPATKADVAGTIRTTSGSDHGTFTCLYDGNLASYEIAFRTGLNNARTERARIDSSGNLLVGVTSAPSTSGGSGFIASSLNRWVLYLGSNASSAANVAQFYNSNGQVGSITTSGSSTAYNTSSDYRLKDNIVPMTGALARVAALKPCTYKWKVDGSDGEGFIAHELQEVVPDCVTGEKDAVETYTDEDGVEQTRPVYQGIDTSFLVATLTAAIQEQQAIILAQESALNALTARVAALEGK